MKEFDKVLIRNSKLDKWLPAFYSNYIEDSNYHYELIGGECAMYCIPYKGNEHFYDTTNDYEELYEPKQGDFIYLKYDCNEYIGIVKTYDQISKDIRTYADSIWLTSENTMYGKYTECRLASIEEKQLLLSKLHESGKDWDPVNKKIIDYKWEPEIGDTVFLIYFASYSCEFTFSKQEWFPSVDKWQENYFTKGFVFKDKQSAQEKVDELNKKMFKI